LEAFRVRAFHYLLKPLTAEKFAQVFQEAVALFKRNAMERPGKKSFTVHRKAEIISLDYDDIDYFEKMGHKIKVHTGEREIEFYGNFIKLLDEIDLDFFAQCHQGYIVNIDKIQGYRDQTLSLKGNLWIPVSRSYIDSDHDRGGDTGNWSGLSFSRFNYQI
jgi:DNA-binding LytR/AlgR family response regulator